MISCSKFEGVKVPISNRKAYLIFHKYFIRNDTKMGEVTEWLVFLSFGNFEGILSDGYGENVRV